MTGLNRKLVREWDRRLRESGFVDIEGPDGKLRGPALRAGDRRRSWVEATPLERVAIRAYFEAAEKFKNRWGYRTLGPKQRLIWRLHAKGLSNTEVAREVHTTVRKVRVVLVKCRRAAGLPEKTSVLGRRRVLTTP